MAKGCHNHLQQSIQTSVVSDVLDTSYANHTIYATYTSYASHTIAAIYSSYASHTTYNDCALCLRTCPGS